MNPNPIILVLWALLAIPFAFFMAQFISLPPRPSPPASAPTRYWEGPSWMRSSRRYCIFTLSAAAVVYALKMIFAG